MFYVAGSNLFGQWFSNNNFFTEFLAISTASVVDCDFDLERAKLVHISWSYNIFEIDNKYFISGARGGKTSQLKRLTLPEECETSSNLIVGNDYKLFVINKCKNTFWVMDLESESDIKKINVSVETPVPFGESVPKRTRIDSEIVRFSVVNDHLLCLTSEGIVYSGFLPSYLDTRHCVGKVTDIQCGYEHFILLTDAGRVYTWGNGRRLQLGHGDVNNIEMPTEIEALAGIKIIKIQAGGWHSLALSEFGDLYAWGWNDTGQLGVKSLEHVRMDGLESYPVPTLVDLFDENNQEINMNVKDIACGSKHSAILLEDNTIWSTGYNKYGQLGLSIDKYPIVKYFQKSLQVIDSPILMCGPWSTVVISDKNNVPTRHQRFNLSA